VWHQLCDQAVVPHYLFNFQLGTTAWRLWASC